MAIQGKVIPPNAIDTLIVDGKATPDFIAFLYNLARTASISGSGTPESNVEAPFLTFYTDTDTNTLYQKLTESGKTGWQTV